MTTWTGKAALAAILLALAGPLSGAGAAFADETAPPALGASPPAISVVRAEVRSIAESIAVTGTMVPREEVQVGVDIEGMKIDELLVDAGDVVVAGQVMARLSTDTLDVQLAQNDSQLARADAAIAQAESQITEATATLTEADAALERTRTLADKGIVSQDVLEQRVSAAGSARARLSMAEQGLIVSRADKALVGAQRREIELRRSKTEIRAPATGLVLERTAKVGAVASPQSGALFRIAREGLVELDAEVIETDLQRVEPGQIVTVRRNGGDPLTGTVRLVSPEVNATTRLGHVRIAFSGEMPLRVGSFTRGSIEVARRDGVTVPVAAVVTSGDTASVQVVRDARVETRAVKTGLSSGGVMEIVEGLEAGDVVVARAGTFLRDGDAITPIAPDDQETKG
jgi:HlyD family secretion protein